MNARITILQDAAPEVDLQAGVSHEPAGFDADVTSIEQPWMEFAGACQVESGVALRIDTEDAVWLGEAEQCSSSGDSFVVRVRLKHVLRDFETLARLAERFGTIAPKRESKEARVRV